jgi:glycosyltransferase involved in cell wall biosynthesis
VVKNNWMHREWTMNGADEQTRDILKAHPTSEPPPLVAIVTPVYNGAQFLAETMDAVQAQTYPNLIHIVHDNASTDETPAIIARYAKARVPVLVARNERLLPLNENWNAAVARVPKEAKYFRILCADDLIAPTFTSRVAELMEANPTIIIAGCDMNHFGTPSIESHWDDDRGVYSGQEALGRFFLGTGLIIAIQSLIRRDALDLRKTFFETTLLHSDTEMCLDLLRHGDWGFVHETLATTRDQCDSVTRTVSIPARLATVDYLVMMERYATHGLGEKQGRALTRKYRRYYLRQLLRWRFRAPHIYDRHVAVLSAAGTGGPFFWQFADAVADWPFCRLGLRSVWQGYPFDFAH